jgi:uncharacterized protein
MPYFLWEVGRRICQLRITNQETGPKFGISRCSFTINGGLESFLAVFSIKRISSLESLHRLITTFVVLPTISLSLEKIVAMPSLYEISVPPMIRGFDTLTHILKKAEEYAKEKGIPLSDFIEGRIAPDMLPLPKQIQIASNTAKNVLVRVGGTEAVPMEDNETTFEELYERIAKTVELLKAADTNVMQGKEGAEVVMKTQAGEAKFTGQSYILTFAVPNFYFHLTTAYAILRNKGVPIGKKDFLLN